LEQKWEWGNQQQYSFETLKQIICSAPILIHANPDERFRIETNASNYIYGAILSQKDKVNQQNHPVTFFSKSMTPAERNYGISDKEALAIVKTLQHWCHWLEGTTIPIDIITNHKNLQYFTKPCILNWRQLQWMDLLKHYNYTIGYQLGTQNLAADALSRQAKLMPKNPEEEEPTTMIPLDCL
jgi:RNase H-like domain found in reverse transcriptase